MLSNYKTSVPGVLLLVAALCTVVSHVIGGGIGMGDLQALMAALAGAGLVAAKDAK